MVSSEAISVPLRLTRSPKWPNRIDPSGRPMKAAPKTANELSSAVAGAWAGKNSAGKTRTAAVA